jgi:hypothetical protein
MRWKLYQLGQEGCQAYHSSGSGLRGQMKGWWQQQQRRLVFTSSRGRGAAVGSRLIMLLAVPQQVQSGTAVAQ